MKVQFIDSMQIVNDYKTEGYCFLENLFTASDLPEFDKLTLENSVKFYEKDGTSLRSIYGFQQNSYFKQWLQRQKLLMEIIRGLIGNSIYLHQTKVNIKNRDESSVWPYHRDFPFWQVFDHIPQNNTVNVVIFLDDVFSGSGELEIFPGSQLEFLPREEANVNVEFSIDGSASSDLLFNFTTEEAEYFKSKYGSVKPVGKKGSVLIFNPDVIHGSGKSSLDFSRKIMILTFNSCENLPLKVSKRPAYLCSTDFTPIQWKE